MTEQEAQAFAERLTRIWVPQSPESAQWQSCTDELPLFQFRALLEPNIKVVILVGSSLIVELSRSGATSVTGQLSYFKGISATKMKHRVIAHRSRNPEYAEFNATWLSFFRRGCWLSGCPIEASAHEKAEWIQGFSREEIEAWNLKM